MSALVGSVVTALVALVWFAPPGDVLAAVDGTPITRRDLDAFLAVRGLSGELGPIVRDRAVEELVDRELVRRFLADRKAEADPEQLDAAVREAKAKFAARGGDPDAALERLGLDDARLKHELALTLAWRKHLDRILTDAQVRGYYEGHRRRFDGTRLRVSQVFVPYAEGESATDAPRTRAALDAVRKEIVGGLPLAEAAKRHSKSPAAAAGGDVGWIGPEGGLPAAVADAAYRLKPGEVSEVVLSPVGAHLVTVTEQEPGDGSLEDARPAVLDALGRELWAATVAERRRAAKIEKPTD